MQIRKSTTSPVRAGKVISKRPVSKLAKKRTQNHKKKVIFISLCVLVLVVAYVFLMRSNIFRINIVEVRGAAPEYVEQIKVDTEQFLNTSILFVLPSRNIFLFSPKDAEKELLLTNSNIEKIVFDRKGLHTLVVQVSIRKPLFVVPYPEKVVYIDKTGRVYSDASVDTNALKGTFMLEEFGGEDRNSTTTSSTPYTERSNQNLPINIKNIVGQSIEQNYFNNLVFYIEELRKKNFDVRSVALRPYGDAYIRVGNVSSQIRVNLYEDRDRTLSTFQAAQKAEPLRGRITNDMVQIQYIDLRYGNKVFYKFN